MQKACLLAVLLDDLLLAYSLEVWVSAPLDL